MEKKIFIGPCEIAGYYSNLAKGFKDLGVEVHFFSFRPHPSNYEVQVDLPFLIKITQYFNLFKINKNIVIRFFISLIAECSSFIWAVSAIFKYDVFIFGFGQSLIRYNLDLYVLKALNKIVISNLAHGSEARPVYIDGAIQNKDHGLYPSVKKLKRIAKRTKKMVSRHEKLVTHIIGSPMSTSQFCTKNFINFFMLGIPTLKVRTNLIDNKIIRSNLKGPIIILHAPSHPFAKGTLAIKRAISNLKDKGYKIDFRLIHGVPNSKVIEQIKKCDFIVDQQYSDTPLAGFATEAAIFGKTSVVGGYAFEYLKDFIPKEMYPPSQICHPDKIDDAIEKLIIDVKFCKLLGEQAQNFVSTKWDAVLVAKKYIRLIDDDIPDSWWVDPYEIFYLEGAGQSRNISVQNVKNLIRNYGISSLQLTHNPMLEKAFIELSKLKI